MVSEHLADGQLVAQLPPVERARAYWLYTAQGRYFDMYLGEGRALFGHRPPRLGLAIKSYISKGLYSAYPHVLSRRLLRNIQRLYPSYAHVVIYANRTRALQALSQIIGSAIDVTNIYDPAQTTHYHNVLRPSVAFSRPLLKSPPADILLPVLPLPLSDAPQIVCSSSQWKDILTGDPLSPLLLAAIQQSLALMDINRSKEMLQAPLRSSHRSDWIDPAPRFGAQIQRHKWRGWNLIANYLNWQGERHNYHLRFQALLKAQILIHPLPEGISILPPLCTKSDYLRFEEVNAILEKRQ